MDKYTKDVLWYWWRKIRDSKIPNLFTDFQDFVNWSKKNGYKYGRRLRRIDNSLDYSPDNMEWVDLEMASPSSEIQNQRAIAKWNRFVEPIRERFRDELELLVEMERQKKIREEQQVREFFRYEHPDLVREGIVYEP
jgi:hypothetical protein